MLAPVVDEVQPARSVRAAAIEAKAKESVISLIDGIARDWKRRLKIEMQEKRYVLRQI